MSETETKGAGPPPTESGNGSTQSAEIEHPFAIYLPGADPATFPKVHPHANIFPMIPMEEMQAMADDIKANRLRHDITTVNIVDDRNGQNVLHILEGRNRWVACTMAGVTPRFLDETLTLTNSKKESATLDLVISENLTRRHLNGPQRDIVAEKLATAKRGGKQNGAFTVEQAAKQLKRSANNVQKVRRLKEKAPKIYAALERGDYKSVDAAYIASGLGKRVTPPEKVFIIREQYGIRRIMHEEVSPKHQNEPYVFKTKAEAEAKLAELLAEAGRRKAEWEATQKAWNDAEAAGLRYCFYYSDSKWVAHDLRTLSNVKFDTEAEAKAETERLNEAEAEAKRQAEAQAKAQAKENADQSEPTEAASAADEGLVDLTTLTQQQLLDKANRAVYPEAAPEPSNVSMRIQLKHLRDADSKPSEDIASYKQSFEEIESVLKYAADAVRKPLLDERLVYWVKLMSLKFSYRLMINRQKWYRSMLNLSYAEKPAKESIWTSNKVKAARAAEGNNPTPK